MHLGTFLRTEDAEVMRLVNDNSGKNSMDFDVYPETTEIPVSVTAGMILELFNAFNAEYNCGYNAVGCFTVGSPEAIILGVMTMKHRWKKNRHASGIRDVKPNLIFGSNAMYAGTRQLDSQTMCSDPSEMLKHVDENTIGVGLILGDMVHVQK
ncbi:hypothetical protein DFQ29_005824 [Apophysomyces sp. BC1021]|nr:hypothetical protein DFQ29_005824 [Apophysomyces sp. BC1021]